VSLFDHLILGLLNHSTQLVSITVQSKPKTVQPAQKFVEEYEVAEPNYVVAVENIASLLLIKRQAVHLSLPA